MHGLQTDEAQPDRGDSLVAQPCHIRPYVSPPEGQHPQGLPGQLIGVGQHRGGIERLGPTVGVELGGAQADQLLDRAFHVDGARRAQR